MLDDANQVTTPTEAETAAPVSQPAQGSDTQAATTVPDNGSTPQGQGAIQQPPMMPKHRFDEVNHRMQRAEQELAQLRQAQTQQPQQQATQAPKQEDFNSYEDFIRADAKFTAEQAAESKWNSLQQRQQEDFRARQEQNRVQAAESNWDQKSYEASTKYPDFDQKLSMALPLTNAYAALVMKASPVAGDLAYHLANNHDLVTRLNGMHPIDAAAELGRIEGKLSGSSGQPRTKPSAGIPVITPVGAGNKAGAIDPYALDTSAEDYVALTRTPPRKR